MQKVQKEPLHSMAEALYRFGADENFYVGDAITMYPEKW